MDNGAFIEPKMLLVKKKKFYIGTMKWFSKIAL